MNSCQERVSSCLTLDNCETERLQRDQLHDSGISQPLSVMTCSIEVAQKEIIHRVIMSQTATVGPVQIWEVLSNKIPININFTQKVISPSGKWILWGMLKERGDNDMCSLSLSCLLHITKQSMNIWLYDYSLFKVLIYEWWKFIADNALLFLSRAAFATIYPLCDSQELLVKRVLL